MATIAEQLAKLNSLKTQLAANLTTKGVSATATEKFNTLVPKVLDISGGESPTTTVLYDATHRDKVSLLYNGTIYNVADFTALHADFCSAKNNYALNYGTTVFGWDYSCYTCCTLPISVTASTQIAIRFLAGSTEVGILRLVQSDTGTAADILAKAQTEGSYTDLPLQWLYSADYITTLTPCEGVAAGTYYLVWVGRSNNSHPLIQSITILSGGKNTMNIIEAMEQLKAGKAIQRTGWGNAKIQAVQLENGQYQIFASGDLTPEMWVLLSGDYETKTEETK